MSKKKTLSKFAKHTIEVMAAEKKKMTVWQLNKMKKKKESVVWVTAYDLPFAYVAEQAGVDMILVGDSGGMVQIIDFNGDIIFDNSKPDGAPKKLLDNSKITKLGWRAKISLEEGIRRTHNWYILNN